MSSFKSQFRLLFCTFFIYSSISTPVNDFYKGLSEFSNNFYLECVKEKPGNVIVSPLSLANALALLSQGASGKTFEQLQHGLHFGNDKEVTATQFYENCEALKANAGDATLTVVNQLYVQQGQELNKDFHDVAVSKFKSGVDTLNFAEPQQSADAINHFVEEKTHGKIKDLFKASDFDASTRSVLVNALYFKGKWELPFKKEATRKGDFYTSETEKISVDFMHKGGDFKYGYLKNLEASAVEMKYAHSKLAFMILLPNQRTGLSAMEARMKNYDLTKITDEMSMLTVDIAMPKFKAEYEIKLNGVLANMGISDIFTEQAELGGILASGEKIAVSDVVQKAYIEVDEEGTEAEAATGMGFIAMSMPPQMRIDHPFMYFIRDTESGAVIFSGRITHF